MSDHNEVSVDLQALADVQQRLGDLPMVVGSMRRAVGIRQRTKGADTAGVIDLADQLRQLETRE